VWYLDTSAAAKLVIAEPETPALMAWVRSITTDVVSSDLIRTELLRATARAAPHAMSRARAVLDSIAILSVPTAIFERAALLGPTNLRSLDAIHLATAIDFGDELTGMITYDERLAEAAAGYGITVAAPA
jgi:uncharacterized protein